MNRFDGGQGFNFDYDRLFDEKVKTVTAIQPDLLVFNRQWQLFLNADAAQRQLST